MAKITPKQQEIIDDVIRQIMPARYDRDMSYRELAEKTGLNPSTLVGCETGRWRPTLPTLAAVADALNITIEINP